MKPRQPMTAAEARVIATARRYHNAVSAWLAAEEFLDDLKKPVSPAHNRAEGRMYAEEETLLKAVGALEGEAK